MSQSPNQSPNLILTHDGPLLRVTLDRPDKRNPLTDEMVAGLIGSVQDAGNDVRYFIPILRRIVRDLETVITATEKEAAVLENELIKQHQPRFNVKLRDDKDFLCLKLDLGKTWPMLETVRRPTQDGARYFGPYHSATSARKTLHLVNKHFQLRTCSDAGPRCRPRWPACSSGRPPRSWTTATARWPISFVIWRRC